MKQTVFWSLHIMCAFLMILLLGMHMIIMHLYELPLLGIPGTENVLAWEKVLCRSKSAFYGIAYTGLLGSGLYHGLYGVRNIIFELSFTKKVEHCIDVFLMGFGIILFFVGTIATFATNIMEIN